VAGWPRLVLRVAGGGLLIAAAAIHFDLYLTGFNNIPTIGWLFLFQVITGFVLGIAVLVYGSRLAAAAGAAFALATLGGYLLSLWVGLFGFKETRTTAGIVAGVLEIAAAAALGMLALTPAPGAVGRHEAVSGIGARLRAGVPWAGLLVTGVSVLALVVLGGSVAAVNTGGGTAAGGGSGGQHRADDEDRRRDRADQRQGPHPVHIRPRQTPTNRSATAAAPPTGRRSRAR
jgi:hypothetical protein